MKLQLIKGWYLPDWDKHYEGLLKKHNGKFEYQQPQRNYALSFVKNWNIALDIGANIGFWSQELCNKFKTVWAFEPHPHNIECYRQNMMDYKNFHLEEIALSDKQQEDALLFVSPDESGNISLIAHGVTHGNSRRTLRNSDLSTTTTDVKRLDDYLNQFEGENIDFIKIDCQEHEKEIVSGGLELLKDHDTVICLELPCRNKKEKQYHNDIVAMLKDIGYTRQGNLKKETIFTR